MSVYTLAANKSYNPSDNTINPFRGTVGATSSSTTVSITGVDVGMVSYFASSSRPILVGGPSLPPGGTVTAASGTTVTVGIPYAVTVTASAASSLLEYCFADAPNAKQYPITRVVAAGSFTLNFVDLDGSSANFAVTAPNTVNELNLTVARTLAGTRGSLLGYSKGYSN